MDSVISIIMSEAMIESIKVLSKSKNCSSNTIIKLAVAKFLFDQTLSTPEIYADRNEYRQLARQQDDITKEIPLDRIIAVQYTLDDGRVIHVKRQSKMR